MLPGDHTRAPRGGPRHAAPRRSLFGRVPAGKAIALAAMPTAVFLGLGLTPRPAIAEDDPADRWRPGPCAEQSDEPKGGETEDGAAAGDGEEAAGAGESAQPGDRPSPSPSATADGSAEQPGGGDADGTGSGTGSGGGSGGGAGGGSGAGGAEGSGEAEPSPSPSESNPWYDPLGLGDKLGDLIDPDEPEAEPEPEPEASGGSEGSGSGGGTGAGSGSGAAQDDERDGTEKAIRDAADEAGATVEELDDKVRETAEDPADAKQDTGDDAAADAGGKQPFPCPTADPEALADAELEPGLPLLPDDPWRLESTKLTLKGLKYHGIVEVKTYSGAVKKVLKYTADDGVDIRDLHQTVVGPGRNTTHVRADKGSTSTIRNGTVTMYTEELKGSLFGLIPLTFSPESPPPLDLPFAFFTDVQVTQAGQFGGTLTVPGLENTIE